MRYLLQGIITAAWRNYHNDWQSFCRCISYTIIYPLQLGFGCLILGRGILLLFVIEIWLREIDDRVDTGKHYNARNYLYVKLKLINCPLTQQRINDKLFEMILRQAHLIGIDIMPELRTVLELMQYEVNLRLCRLPISNINYQHFAASQDAAVLSICAKILEGNVKICQEVISSFGGVLTRTDWLNDLLEDLHHDCFLLPAELIQNNRTTIKKLHEAVSWNDLWNIPNFCQWYQAEVNDLEKKWNTLHILLNNHCGNIFSKTLTGWLVHRAIIHEQETEFQQVRLRIKRFNKGELS